MDSSETKSTFFEATTEDPDEANLFVLGIPWDTSSSYRKGSAASPKIIRQATSGELYNPYTENNVNIKDKWLIFDAGDVLVHKIVDNQVKAWYKIQNLLKNNDNKNDDLFTQIYEKIRSIGRIEEVNFISIVTGETFQKYRHNTIDIRLYEEYEIEKWWRNPDSALLKTLKQLKEIGYRIGILTDSALTSEHIGEVLDDYSYYIDIIVSSRDVGGMKPNPRMYLSILSLLNTAPEKALFIAHDREELEGAEKLGILVENFEEIKNLSVLVKKIKQKYVFST